MEVVKKRTLDDIRSKIADDAAESRHAFYDGKLSVGSVDDLIREIKREKREKNSSLLIYIGKHDVV